jgi:hypothetical protein
MFLVYPTFPPSFEGFYKEDVRINININICSLMQ